ETGLVHISQMASKFIRNPQEIVAVNDIVSVWVVHVDLERRRVSLTMIPPGSDRTVKDRRPRREDQRAKRGRRPEGAEATGSDSPSASETSGGARPGPTGRGGRDLRSPRGRPPSHDAARAAPAQPAGKEPPPQATPPGEGTAVRTTSAPASTPPSTPRRPRREPPKPQLSQAALEGKVPLRTFSELSALFAAKREKASSVSTNATGDGSSAAVEVSATAALSQSGSSTGEPTESSGESA
ncbi:MAG: S1 RNA-binding domain-containing protein, partial [Gemmataceae bacterium]|nr:S1 RNA-binding domain-containing protein [Gemmataceae bacterium]